MSTGTTVEVVMPQMGVSVSEGTVTRWLKQPGDEVTLDEPLLEISTDKVDTEVPSPGEGVVAEIRVQEGETVEVGTVLATIAPAGTAAAEAPAEPAPAAEPAPEPPAPEAAAAEPEPQPAAEPVAEAPPQAEAAPATAPTGEPVAPQEQAVPQAGGNGRTFVSPVVARIAAQHGIDPNAVPGTGQGGRVTKKDILAFIESGAATPPAHEAPPAQAPAPAPVAAPEGQAAPAAPAPHAEPAAPARPAVPAEAPTAAPPAPPAPVTVGAAAPVAGEHEEPMNAMRRGVAEHMRRSLDTSAHVTSAIEVDMSRVVAARERLKKEYEATYGVNPTYLAFVTKAAVETLKDWPWINGEIRGDKIVTRPYVNVGIAVALEDGKGLIVPVIRNSQDLNLLGVARAIADLAERARTKKLMPDDVQGGTFTVTNPGGFGTFHGTPIISQPQAGILGTYALVKRPWVVQDELGQDVIAIRPLMNVTLTYDHRLVDGAYAGGFLRDLRKRLEEWDEGSA
ncbi:MAG TPA: dihydrolipoamide acetyltransferase family protein [Gaiella sp.]|uniref:dihydrolipoamide acetyltransferase family protein n=1 Tax=Gaiella sp. TaxID=2663207 RepID=UPI002D7E3D85|nr:dihydrolipoamide acetyltransferase family protein [Gaiella sp.]HET9288392.1 dihydrolipoamide acetyltransferase family protein [Gaiella sp.]